MLHNLVGKIRSQTDGRKDMIFTEGVFIYFVNNTKKCIFSAESLFYPRAGLEVLEKRKSLAPTGILHLLV